MTPKSLIVLLAGFILFALGWNSFFIISETQQAVQLRFGQLVSASLNPGLHIKFPFVDKVKIFDARLQNLEVPSERFLTLEQKAVLVDSYIKWRIDDVNRFYRATAGDLYRANALLSQRAESRMRNKFGELTLTEVVSGQRDQLMVAITSELNTVAKSELGVTIIDVRVKRIDLPTQVSDSVYERMSSERNKEAQEYRSKGFEIAEGIRANADREARVVLAEAYRDAEKIRGMGDAKAAAVYADAFSRNPEFYTFLRSLEAYRNTFNDSGSLMVLEPNSDFFNYLNNKKGSSSK